MPEKKKLRCCKINDVSFLILRLDKCDAMQPAVALPDQKPPDKFFLLEIEIEHSRDQNPPRIAEGTVLTGVFFDDYKFATLIVDMPPGVISDSPKRWEIQCSEPKAKAEGGGR